MKALSLLLLTFLLTRSARAQFWIVSDKDGFVNVRDSANTRSKIHDTLNNGHFIYTVPVEEQTGAWLKIVYHHKGKDREGYVYRDRLNAVADYDSIPLQNYTENIANYSHDSIKVVITQQKIDKTKYRYSRGETGYIEKVNGKPYWGTDGEMPKRAYKSIVIFAGASKIVMPRVAFDNLFEPTVYNTEIHYDRANDIFYIRAENSDGAGSYDVIWRIVKGVYTDSDIQVWD